MPSNLKEAIDAIKAGDKQAGRKLLVEIIKAEPRNEIAWLWLTKAVDTLEDQRRCLEQVLEINPNNETAQKALAIVAKNLARREKPQPAKGQQASQQIPKKRQRPAAKTRRPLLPTLVGLSLLACACLICGPALILPSLTSNSNQQSSSATAPTSVSVQTPTSLPKVNIIDRTKIQSRFEWNHDFSFKPSSPVNGRPRITGESPDGLVRLELIGDYDRLDEATMIFAVPHDARQIAEANTPYLSDFIKLSAPEIEGVKWLNENLQKEEAHISNEHVEVSYSWSEIGDTGVWITLTIERYSSQQQTQDTPTAILATPTIKVAVTPPLQGGIKVTRQELVRHFENQGFTWKEETYQDGTHFMSGQSPDGQQKLNLWSTNNPEDLTEMSFSFYFSHDLYFSSNREEVQTYKQGLERMIETVILVFPNWTEGEEWIKAGLQSLPEPLSADVEKETMIDGVEVYFGIGDLSEREYSVSFDVVE